MMISCALLLLKLYQFNFIGCLQSMLGLHTFRVESIARGRAAPVDELQVQGMHNPGLLRKVKYLLCAVKLPLCSFSPFCIWGLSLSLLVSLLSDLLFVGSLADENIDDSEVLSVITLFSGHRK